MIEVCLLLEQRSETKVEQRNSPRKPDHRVVAGKMTDRKPESMQLD